MQNIQDSISIFWFRRDLRLEDNAGLYHALKEDFPVLPLFIFDTKILNKLDDKEDRRIDFIHLAINELEEKLRALKSSILIKHGDPLHVWKTLIKEFDIKQVFANHDYEPYAKERDEQIYKFLQTEGIEFKTFKDQCIFEKNEILKANNEPYTVFTPYSRKWKEAMNPFFIKTYPTEKYFGSFIKTNPFPTISTEELGFKKTDTTFPPKDLIEEIIKNYAETRNFPSFKGTSRLSVHLRFGTISIRKLVSKAHVLNQIWLNELIWRDFYMMILWHFPHVEKQSFKKDYDKIIWRNNEAEFKAWCEGKTGYPIVDAGMRELNSKGFMHNRVRMITASFLSKHLLIDWRWGEAYFAKKLLDYDLAANNGGWQWASGSGCDAAPYFRIFNPTLQTQKFDKDLAYIKKWVPEFNSLNYCMPIVNHEFARNRALKVYKEALQS